MRGIKLVSDKSLGRLLWPRLPTPPDSVLAARTIFCQKRRCLAKITLIVQRELMTENGFDHLTSIKVSIQEEILCYQPII